MRRAADWLRRRVDPKAVILMYHRVRETPLDPWGLSVTPAHFAEQLEVLQKFTRPLSLRELVAAHRAQEIPDRAVVITFDDGYVDNLTQAKPLLEQCQVPAVVFLISAAVGAGREFWWDALGRALLLPARLPDTLTLTIQGRRQEWQLGRGAGYSETERRMDRKVKPWEAPASARLAFFYSVWQRLLPLPAGERRAALEGIRDWAGAARGPGPADRALTFQEAKELARSGLVELGAHTATHPSLPVLSRSAQLEQIQCSKALVEQISGIPATLFSYPHGDYTPETAALLREAGFHCACTTLSQTCTKRTDLFELPRFQVEDWDGREFQKRISRWFRTD